MTQKYTIKQILLTNQSWWRFHEKHKTTLRPAIVTCITKLLSCKNIIRGFHEHHCSNPNCSHIKRVFFTCKCRACSSCGKKATEAWVHKQNQILPNTSWQHITFTMPCELWDFFWYNRKLLNLIGSIAANCIMILSKKKKVLPGMFIAIHTFGRDLKRNVHIHLSVTTGGLSEDRTQWKNMFFHQATLMRMWRYQIISLFRKMQAQLTLPKNIKEQINTNFTFNKLLDQLYKKEWIVHCAKPTADHKQNVNYLSRYLKRPAIAESRLKHYNGYEITFKYLDHKTNRIRRFTLTIEQFIARFVQHIPDTGFRMIRYYGFLSNRTRKKLLPIVYKLIGQNIVNQTTLPTYAELMQKNFNFNPLTCILCGQQLVLSLSCFGKTTVSELLNLHRELALLKNF
jgi:hypothetical protein